MKNPLSKFKKFNQEHDDIEKRLEEEEQKTRELQRRLRLLEIEVSTFKPGKAK